MVQVFDYCKVVNALIYHLEFSWFLYVSTDCKKFTITTARFKETVFATFLAYKKSVWP